MSCIIAIIPRDNGNYIDGDVVQAFEARLNADGKPEWFDIGAKTGNAAWLTSFGKAAHKDFFFAFDPERGVRDYSPEHLVGGKIQITNVNWKAVELPYSISQIRDQSVSIPIVKLSKGITNQLYGVAVDRITEHPVIGMVAEILKVK